MSGLFQAGCYYGNPKKTVLLAHFSCGIKLVHSESRGNIFDQLTLAGPLNITGVRSLSKKRGTISLRLNSLGRQESGLGADQGVTCLLSNLLWSRTRQPMKKVITKM